MKNKKKNKVITKLKKVFNLVVKEVSTFFKNMYKNFMSLPKNVRYIICVWGVIVVVILALIIGSSSNAKFLEQYAVMEEELNASALDYVNTKKLYPTMDNKLILDMEVFRDYNYLYDDYVVDDNCTGFSVIYMEESTEKYIINSYLNCDHYTTEGYNDYKQ